MTDRKVAVGADPGAGIGRAAATLFAQESAGQAGVRGPLSISRPAA